MRLRSLILGGFICASVTQLHANLGDTMEQEKARFAPDVKFGREDLARGVTDLVVLAGNMKISVAFQNGIVVYEQFETVPDLTREEAEALMEKEAPMDAWKAQDPDGNIFINHEAHARAAYCESKGYRGAVRHSLVIDSRYRE